MGQKGGAEPAPTNAPMNVGAIEAALAALRGARAQQDAFAPAAVVAPDAGHSTREAYRAAVAEAARARLAIEQILHAGGEHAGTAALVARVGALEAALRRAAAGYRSLDELGLLAGEYARGALDEARRIDAALDGAPGESTAPTGTRA